VEKALRGPFSVEKLTLWLKPAEFRDFRAVRNLLTRDLCRFCVGFASVLAGGPNPY
jgi:hypothetical protein